MAELSGEERAELDRLRLEEKARGGPARVWRWVGASLVLVIAAVLGSLSVVAVYLRSEVLDTNTYVETVAPLGSDPTVRTAVAQRLTDELITRSNVEDLAKQLADRLVAEGAPQQITDLVSPLVNGISSFLNSKINQFMATERFQRAWENVNRIGHQGLVTTLTGGQGQVITSQGTTVTVDLGELLSIAKQQLVSEGLSIFAKIPDVSIPYTLVESNELPKIRTYTKLLNAAGTWLPWVALVVLAGGILLAPNRRRGIIVGAVLLGVVTALVLAAVTIARTSYVDNLPAHTDVKSPEAVAIVISTVLRYLIASLQALLVVCLVAVIFALLAGPSAVAVWIRRQMNRGLDALAGLLRQTGDWTVRTGHALAAAVTPLRIVIVVLAVVLLVVANRPGIAAVLWTTFAVLVVLAALEVFVRAASRPKVGPGPTVTAPA